MKLHIRFRCWRFEFMLMINEIRTEDEIYKLSWLMEFGIKR